MALAQHKMMHRATGFRPVTRVASRTVSKRRNVQVVAGEALPTVNMVKQPSSVSVETIARVYSGT